MNRLLILIADSMIWLERERGGEKGSRQGVNKRQMEKENLVGFWRERVRSNCHAYPPVLARGHHLTMTVQGFCVGLCMVLCHLIWQFHGMRYPTQEAQEERGVMMSKLPDADVWVPFLTILLLLSVYYVYKQGRTSVGVVLPAAAVLLR